MSLEGKEIYLGQDVSESYQEGIELGGCLAKEVILYGKSSMSEGALLVRRCWACFGKNSLPCLVPDLRGKASGLSPLSITLAVGFCQCPLSD